MADPRPGAPFNCTPCLMCGASPVPITPPQVDFPSCGEGALCPNLNTSLASRQTWPQICPATPNCSLLRLSGGWCEPQGTFEPFLCLPGRYCPDSSTSLVCPEGSWCIRGSSKPRPCEVMSYCPEGTVIGRFYGGIMLAVLIDVLLIVIYLWLRCVREPAMLPVNAAARRKALLAAAGDLARGGGGKGSPVRNAWAAASDGGVVSPNPLRIIAPDGGEVVEGGSADGGSADGSSVAQLNALRGSKSADAVTEWDSVRPPPSSPASPPPSCGQRVSEAFAALSRSRTALPPGVGRDSGGRVRTKSIVRLRAGNGSAINSGDAFDTLALGDGGDGGGFTGAVGSSSGDDGESQPPMSAASAAYERACLSAANVVLKEGFRRCNAGQRLVLDFDDLGYTLPKPLDKTILEGVTGSIQPGRVTAIMGPSGAGKTTFLNVLMGRLAKTRGTLLVNGQVDEMRRFGRITGFVPQDDVMLGELTVRENIAHSARVRLPRAGWPSSAVSTLVDAVIQVLGLSACADTPTSRVSGGQRKRTNIGMELATAPCAIFLDEPTSGLDATAALAVCNTLRAIADLGLTVVAVIHQPRAEIFQSFDDLLLLAPGGKTVYEGPRAEVVRFFEDAGMSFPAGGNPADDLLDFIAGRHTLDVPTDLYSQLTRSVLSVKIGAAPALGPASPMAPASPQPTQALLGDGARSPVAVKSLDGGATTRLQGREVTAFLTSRWTTHAASVGKRAPPSAAAADATARAAAATGLNAIMAGRGASLLRQFTLCHARSLLQQYRTPTWLALELGVCCLAGSIMGLAATAVDELYNGVLAPPLTPISPAPQEALLPSLGFYICMAVGVAGSPAAVRVFGEERDIFFREVSAHHSAGAYFWSKNVAVLYRLALASLHFAGCFVVLATPTAFFSVLFTMVILTAWGVYGLAALNSMLVSRANAALLGTIASLIVACLCGFGPSLTQGREWVFFIWLQDIAYSRYAVEYWISEETKPYRDLFLVEDVTAATFGYTLDRPEYDIGLMFAIGFAERVLAFGALLLLARLNNR